MNRANASQDKHLFAVYVPTLSERVAQSGVGSLLSIDDASLHHRIYTVLRLAEHEEIILFDTVHHVTLALASTTRKHCVHGIVRAKSVNQLLQPSITVLLPMLKREAFIDALYACVELGATHIQPVTTHKTQRGGAAHDRDRLMNVMIAAAEQSKHYTLPELYPVLSLEQAIDQVHVRTARYKMVADPEGAPFFDLLATMHAQPDSCVIAVGPEGGLVGHEKQLLGDRGFLPCALTPTILRAQQGVALSIGAIRAVLKQE